MNCSHIYGPGERFVIWVQGCSIHCQGCWNKEMWSFQEKSLYTVSNLFDRVMQEDSIDGITILGGEPLDQSVALIEFVSLVKETHLSILLYTGYEKEEIESDELRKRICNSSDILISGRYNKNLRSTNLKWRGSTNQQIIINNHKYEDIVHNHPEQNEVELHIDEEGNFIMLGYPDECLKKEFLS